MLTGPFSHRLRRKFNVDPGRVNQRLMERLERSEILYFQCEVMESNSVFTIKRGGRCRVNRLPEGEHKRAICQKNSWVARDLAHLLEFQYVHKKITGGCYIWNGEPDVMSALCDRHIEVAFVKCTDHSVH